ncbi:MAG TPA: FAD-binding oxidoreductase [Candidatus Tectomicrobia bacterium]|nr:FAD-binding oxidoreductase [Candidatus Tectomicrobia bacterium]
MKDLRVTTFNGEAIVLEAACVAEFKQSLRGQLITPDDEGYDEARQVWNANIDRRPGLICRPAGVGGVVAAVNFARDHQLLLAVRGGAHNVAGTCVCNGGMVIDLCLMKGIRVDPIRRTVRAEGGVKWGEFDRETQAFGLATTGGTIADTGIAGLTLGGGHGWLGYKFGLASDNLVSVDVVTADGQFSIASDTEQSDLFWAVRGGGGNFGVVTSFEYRLYAVGPVLAGLVFHPFEKAKEVLRFYRDFSNTTHTELTTYAVPMTSPEGTKVVAIGVCYDGPVAEGERLIAPIRRFGPPLADHIHPMPYTELQSMFDAALPPGNQYYVKAHFLREISDDAIDIVVDHFARVPSPLSLPFFQQTGGAMQRGHTAYAHRDALYNLVLVAEWLDPRESQTHVRWVRDLWQALCPYATGGVYVNDIGREMDDGAEQIRAAYGVNYQRLSELKQRYDPENLFGHNQNIKPKAS